MCIFGNQLSIPNLGAIFPNMGTMSHSLSLSDALFSKVQQRVLALIFTHPERSFYTSEIVRNVRSGVGAVERELSKLERSGLVSVERIGNQKHYRANRAAPIFEELRGLVEKTVGFGRTDQTIPRAIRRRDQERLCLRFCSKGNRYSR